MHVMGKVAQNSLIKYPGRKLISEGKACDVPGYTVTLTTAVLRHCRTSTLLPVEMCSTHSPHQLWDGCSDSEYTTE